MCSIERDILQTTQHDDVIGGNVAIVHAGYQPPPPVAMSTLQEFGVPHVEKGQSYIKHETLLFQYILEHPNE